MKRGEAQPCAPGHPARPCRPLGGGKERVAHRLSDRHRILGMLAYHRVEHQRDVADVARDRPVDIERAKQRIGRTMGDAPRAWAQPHHRTVPRRDAHGTRHVGTSAKPGFAGRHRDSGAPDEPPGVWATFQGLSVVPNTSLVVLRMRIDPVKYARNVSHDNRELSIVVRRRTGVSARSLSRYLPPR